MGEENAKIVTHGKTRVKDWDGYRPTLWPFRLVYELKRGGDYQSFGWILY